MYYHASQQVFEKFVIQESRYDTVGKYGSGIYFSSDYNSVKIHTVGNDYAIYACNISRIDNLNHFPIWDDYLDKEIYLQAIELLTKKGYTKLVDEWEEELGQYGELVSFGNYYSQLAFVLGGTQQASKFFTLIDVWGTQVPDAPGYEGATVVCVYNTDAIKIEKLYLK
jgi:hypothetical protein